MSNDIITETESKRKKKIFTAKFHKYTYFSDGEKDLHFITIEDERENLIKSHYYVKASKVKGCIEEFTIGEKVTFTATMLVDAKYPDGFDFADISFLGKDNN